MFGPLGPLHSWATTTWLIGLDSKVGNNVTECLPFAYALSLVFIQPSQSLLLIAKGVIHRRVAKIRAGDGSHENSRLPFHQYFRS